MEAINEAFARHVHCFYKGSACAAISRKLGIPIGLSGRWQRRFQVNEKPNTLELSDIEQLRQEMRELKRELEITRMERDILKTYIIEK